MKRHALFVGVDEYAGGHIPSIAWPWRKTRKIADFAVACTASMLSWHCAMAIGPKWLEFMIIPFALWTAVRMTSFANRFREPAPEKQPATMRRIPAWKFGLLSVVVLLAALAAHAYIPLAAFALWPETIATNHQWIVGTLLHLAWTAAFSAIAASALRFRASRQN